MTCPPDIARVLLRILHVAVLRIRARGSRGAIEADHVHNLPALLLDYSDDLLRFYRQVEIPAFIKACPAADLPAYESLWAELAELVEGRDGRPVLGPIRPAAVGAGEPPREHEETVGDASASR